MSADAWIALVALVAGWLIGWLSFLLTAGKRLQRIEQTLYDDDSEEGVVTQIKRLRRDTHWLASCALILSLTDKVELPERPSLK